MQTQAMPYLVWGESHADAEIALRCHSIATQVRIRQVEHTMASLKPVSGKWPCLDFLPEKFQTPEWYELQHYWERARDEIGNIQGGAPGDWPAYRKATEYWLRERLLAGMSVADASAALEGMQTREAAWMKASQIQPATPE